MILKRIIFIYIKESMVYTYSIEKFFEFYNKK